MLKVLDNILSESSTANKNKGREKHSTFLCFFPFRIQRSLDIWMIFFQLLNYVKSWKDLFSWLIIIILCILYNLYNIYDIRHPLLLPSKIAKFPPERSANIARLMWCVQLILQAVDHCGDCVSTRDELSTGNGSR